MKSINQIVSEKNLDEVQGIEIVNEEGKPDPQLIEKRTKVDFFILERLNKQKYSSRTELTGKDGKDLPTPILNGISSDNSNSENSETEKEN